MCISRQQSCAFIELSQDTNTCSIRDRPIAFEWGQCSSLDVSPHGGRLRRWSASGAWTREVTLVLDLRCDPNRLPSFGLAHWETSRLLHWPHRRRSVDREWNKYCVLAEFDKRTALLTGDAMRTQLLHRLSKLFSSTNKAVKVDAFKIIPSR